MMNKFKAISIIIATYNSGKTLDKCLSSLNSQLYKNFELIIIDNNSNDDTDIILSKYSSIISHFVKESDAGIYDAWNKGVKISSGDWLCFIGADDYLHSNSLLFLFDLAKKSPNCNFITGKINLINNFGSKIIGEPFCLNKLNYYQNFAHIASLTSKKLFLNFQFNEFYKISGDYEFYIKNRNNIVSCYLDLVLADSEFGVSRKSSKVFIENYLIWKRHNIHPVIVCELLFLYQFFGFYFKYFFNKVF